MDSNFPANIFSNLLFALNFYVYCSDAKFIFLMSILQVQNFEKNIMSVKIGKIETLWIFLLLQYYMCLILCKSKSGSHWEENINAMKWINPEEFENPSKTAEQEQWTSLFGFWESKCGFYCWLHYWYFLDDLNVIIICNRDISSGNLWIVYVYPNTVPWFAIFHFEQSIRLWSYQWITLLYM